jgi:hypothetical protein
MGTTSLKTGKAGSGAYRFGEILIRLALTFKASSHLGFRDSLEYSVGAPKRKGRRECYSSGIVSCE